MKHPFKEWKSAAPLLLTAVAGGCAMMTSDVRIDATVKPVPSERGEQYVNVVGEADNWNHGRTPVCQTYAGSYALPKTFVQVTIKSLDKKQDDPTKDDRRFEIQEIKLVRREDPRHTYCLDYNASPLSDDVIAVKKAALAKDNEELLGGPGTSFAEDKSKIVAGFQRTNLLATVGTDGIDRSRFIAQQLVQTIFTTRLQQGRNRRSSRQLKIENDIAAQLEFDPFDPYATARANRTLSKLGFCVVLGGYTFNWQHARIEDYCRKPTKSVKKHRPTVRGRDFIDMMAEYDEQLKPVRKGKRSGWKVKGTRQLAKGILYRPTISYPLYVFGNPDGEDGRWSLRVKQEVELENISPIIAVDIDRPFFNRRTTRLEFEGGVLKSVCIRKTSELLEIAEIPFVVVNAITDLPTKILQLRFSDTDSDRQLAAAENKLLKAQLDYINELSSPTPQAAAGTLGPADSFTDPSTGAAFPITDRADRFPDPSKRADTDRCAVTNIVAEN